MIKTKFALISLGLMILIISCKPTTKTETEPDESVHLHRYASMDGLWRVTPETATKYPHGTLEPVIQISGDAPGSQLTARGCFLWDDSFYDYWEFKSIQYIDSASRLVMADKEGGIYKGYIDNNRTLIRGTAFWDDDEDASRLDFVRDENTDADRLFTPYPPGRDGSVKYAYRIPETHQDQLQAASVFSFVTDTTALYDLIEKIIRQKYGRLESLLILKDKKLVLEEYFYGFDRTQLHRINSCTKSITSLLLGIALDRHNALDAGRPVFEFFPEFDSIVTEEQGYITLKHVLTMTSGLPDEDDFEIHDPLHFVQQLISQPLESAPGEKFKYNNNGTNLLGCIIYALEKKQADEYAKEVLFNKLGISEFDWDSENGVLQCHNGLHMVPRDLAKIGLLVLNDGFWNGEQVVPKEWIDISTKPEVAESEFFDYGYQWWHRSKRNQSWWSDPLHGSNDEHDMFLALGHGGQFIMVIRELNMVIVTTSSDYNGENGMGHQKVPMVIEEVVPLFD